MASDGPEVEQVLVSEEECEVCAFLKAQRGNLNADDNTLVNDVNCSEGGNSFPQPSVVYTWVKVCSVHIGKTFKREPARPLKSSQSITGVPLPARRTQKFTSLKIPASDSDDSGPGDDVSKQQNSPAPAELSKIEIVSKQRDSREKKLRSNKNNPSDSTPTVLYKENPSADPGPPKFPRSVNPQQVSSTGGKVITLGKSDNTWVNTNPVLFNLFHEYLDELDDLERSRATLRIYEAAFKRLVKFWPGICVADFNSAGFLAVLESKTPLGWQKVTRAVFLLNIATFGNWLARRKLTNVRHHAKSPGRRPKWRKLPTDDEVQMLISSLSERAANATEGRKRTRENDWLIVRIIEETGMRISEVLGLMVDDVLNDEHGPRILISENDHRGLKTFSAERAVEISAQLASDLRAFRARWHIARGLIFKSKTRRPLAANEFTTWLRVYCRDLGIKCAVTPHVFRHRHILKIIERGDSALAVMSRIGHEDVEMTVYYFNQVRRLMPWVELHGDVALLERTRRFWQGKSRKQN